MARFSTISLLIDIDDEYWAPNLRVLRAPVKLNPEKSRVIFHETVHFWQQCSQTFLVRMAEENWERLKTFEDSGEVPELGPKGLEYTHMYEEHGFSARYLQEGLARYWDVHVINPVTLMDIEIKDKNRCIPASVASRYKALKGTAAAIDPSGYPAAIFDLAMDFTAGNYAKPYIDIRDRTSSFVAAVLFPLAGHFALQSERPVPFFVELVERSIQEVAASQTPGVALIEIWPIWYHRIRNHAVQLHKETSEQPFYPAGVIMEHGGLSDHPLYYYIINMFAYIHKKLPKSPKASEYLVPGYEHVPEIHAQLSVDFYTACPGIPKFRSFLVESLAPPCIRFQDGKVWMLRLEHLKEYYPDMSQEEVSSIEADMQRVVDLVLDIDNRWRIFRLASLGIGETHLG